MTVIVGEQIQAGTGAWTGNPTSYTYQWQWSDDGISSDGSLAGETRSDHIVTSDDLGLYLRVGVTATNAGGSSTVSYSAWAGPVGAVEGLDVPAFDASDPRLATYSSSPSPAVYDTNAALASFASVPSLAAFDTPEPL